MSILDGVAAGADAALASTDNGGGSLIGGVLDLVGLDSNAVIGDLETGLGLYERYITIRGGGQATQPGTPSIIDQNSAEVQQQGGAASTMKKAMPWVLGGLAVVVVWKFL